jgi:hypothetical protein
MNSVNDYEMIVKENEIIYRRHNVRKYSNFNFTNYDLNQGIMVNFPHESYYHSNKAKLRYISPNKVFLRAGFIPYTIINNIKYFCMAYDATYGTLTDFGGSTKKNEPFLHAACRELCEESLGVFKFTTPSMIEKVRRNATIVYDRLMCIVFVNLEVKDLNETVKDFANRYHMVTKSENSGITWIPEKYFFDIIKSGKTIQDDGYIYPPVYKVVSDLLRSVSNINEIV